MGDLLGSSSGGGGLLSGLPLLGGLLAKKDAAPTVEAGRDLGHTAAPIVTR